MLYLIPPLLPQPISKHSYANTGRSSSASAGSMPETGRFRRPLSRNSAPSVAGPRPVRRTQPDDIVGISHLPEHLHFVLPPRTPPPRHTPARIRHRAAGRGGRPHRTFERTLRADRPARPHRKGSHSALAGRSALRRNRRHHGTGPQYRGLETPAHPTEAARTSRKPIKTK